MLVVTLVLAAVVSAFVGGIGGDMQGAPSTILEVHVYGNKHFSGESGDFYTPEMTVESLSGDVVSTKDLYIVTYFTNKSGTTLTGRLSGEEYVSGSSGWDNFDENTNCGVLFFSDSNRFDDDDDYYMLTSDTGNSAWFGNRSAVLRPGDILVTPARYCGDPDDEGNNPNEGIEKLFGLSEGSANNQGYYADQNFFAGNRVDVKILHYPSGKCIYDKEVVIE